MKRTICWILPLDCQTRKDMAQDQERNHTKRCISRIFTYLDFLSLPYRSRLGCQVLMTKELAGLTAKIPSATRNMYVDGAKPKHH